MEKTEFVSLSKKIVGSILDIIFPIECLGCWAPGAYFCRICRQHCIDTNIERHCPVCLGKSPVGSTHHKCLSPHAIDGIFGAGNFYDPILQDAVKKLKYKNVKALAPELALFVYEQLKIHFWDWLREINFNITFVPLYPKREKRRGYNQSELIARELSVLSGIPMIPALERIKETGDQTKLNRLKRFLNMEKAFNLKTRVRGKNFLIIDDVFTTGATIMEASKILKRNGAEIVWGITAAKESDNQNKRHPMWGQF